nr:DUF5658 family protein [uncultured Methanoregula sp.]
MPVQQVFPIRDTGTRRTLFWGTAILGSLFILDILSTEIILRFGGVEQNPVMIGIVQWPLLHLAVKIALLVLVFFMVLVAEGHLKGSGKIFFILLIGMYLFVICNNIANIAMNLFTG